MPFPVSSVAFSFVPCVNPSGMQPLPVTTLSLSASRRMEGRLHYFHTYSDIAMSFFLWNLTKHGNVF